MIWCARDPGFSSHQRMDGLVGGLVGKSRQAESGSSEKGRVDYHGSKVNLPRRDSGESRALK